MIVCPKYVGKCKQSPEHSIRSPGARIIVGCKSLNLSSRNETLGLWWRRQVLATAEILPALRIQVCILILIPTIRNMLPIMVFLFS